MKRKCAVLACTMEGVERHHIFGRDEGIYGNCRICHKEFCEHVEFLCTGHHIAITMVNTVGSRFNSFQKRSSNERWVDWQQFVRSQPGFQL